MINFNSLNDMKKYPFFYKKLTGLHNNFEDCEYINKNTPFKYQNDMTLLSKKLLSIGGKKVILPDIETNSKELLSNGFFIYGYPLLLIKGQSNRCHQNSIEYWYENKSFYTHFMSGYALGDDNIWRQHSWCWKHNYIVETTINRICYFGIIYNNEKAFNFYKYYQNKRN